MRIIDISKALAIEGWMNREELLWLAQQAMTHTIIVEVGSFAGRSTRALADNTDGKVFAVDDFLGPRDAEMTVEDLSLTLYKFLTNTRGCSNIVPVVCSHRNPDVIYRIKGVPDMIFIDGSHEYADVKADILLWQTQLSAGGLMCGHDYNPAWPGVVQAVDEIYGDRARKVAGGDIWEVYR